jgi:hypothetical protein
MNSENPHLFVEYMHVKYPDLSVKKPVHGTKTIVTVRE